MLKCHRSGAVHLRDIGNGERASEMMCGSVSAYIYVYDRKREWKTHLHIQGRIRETGNDDTESRRRWFWSSQLSDAAPPSASYGMSCPIAAAAAAAFCIFHCFINCITYAIYYSSKLVAAIAFTRLVI